MVGGAAGPRPSRPTVKGPSPKSPAAFFAAQGQSVQKSAKSEPGVKQRSASGDIGSDLHQNLISPKLSLDDITMAGHSPKSKSCSPVPASPKRLVTPGLKIQSKPSSGRDTPTTGRSQVFFSIHRNEVSTKISSVKQGFVTRSLALFPMYPCQLLCAGEITIW